MLRGIGAYSRRARGGIGSTRRGAASGRGFIPKAKVEEHSSSNKNAGNITNPIGLDGRAKSCSDWP